MGKRIEREKRTVRLMIGLYCRHHLRQTEPSAEYVALADYACKRLDHCKFGEKKTTCEKCPIHCYAPQKREQIRQVMRWTGPRMLFFAPIAAFMVKQLESKEYVRSMPIIGS